MPAPTGSGRTRSPARGATPRRSRTASWPSCSTSTPERRSSSIHPRRPRSTSAKRASTPRVARRSPIWWGVCTATSSAPSRATSGRTTSSRPKRSWCSSMLRRLEIWLVLLLALAMGVAVWAGNRSGGGTPDFDFRASAFLSGPRGSSATYEVLARLRIPVERRRTPLFDLERDARHRPAVLVVFDPPLDLAAAELAQVVRFVRGGGAVVVAGHGGGPPPRGGGGPSHPGGGWGAGE